MFETKAGRLMVAPCGGMVSTMPKAPLALVLKTVKAKLPTKSVLSAPSAPYGTCNWIAFVSSVAYQASPPMLASVLPASQLWLLATHV